MTLSFFLLPSVFPEGCCPTVWAEWTTGWKLFRVHGALLEPPWDPDQTIVNYWIIYDNFKTITTLLFYPTHLQPTYSGSVLLTSSSSFFVFLQIFTAKHVGFCSFHLDFMALWSQLCCLLQDKPVNHRYSKQTLATIVAHLLMMESKKKNGKLNKLLVMCQSFSKKVQKTITS